MKKVQNIEDIDKRLVVTNQLCEVFSILKEESISTEDYDVVLLLLSLFKDDLLHDIKPEEDYLSILENRIFNPDKDFFKKNYFTLGDTFTKNYGNFYYYKQLLPIFKPSFHKINSGTFLKIYNIFKSVNGKDLCFNFSSIFKNILQKVLNSKGRFNNDFITPSELTGVITGIANVVDDDKVFNPFAGFGSFAETISTIHKKGRSFYHGQEKNTKIWALGTLYLLATQQMDGIVFENTDSIIAWPDENEKYDLIVSNPPWGFKFKDELQKLHPGIDNTEQFLIEKGVKSLSEKGKLIAVLPFSFLFRKGKEEDLRKQLIEADLIETIISLPVDLFESTSIQLIILVINKRKKFKGSIKLINAKEMLNTYSRNLNTLNAKHLISVCESSTPSDELKFVSINDLKESNYDLNLFILKSFQNEFEGELLRNFCSPALSKSGKNVKRGKYINIKDLKTDIHKFTLFADDIEEQDLPVQARKIDFSCLLLAVRWNTLKPTYFEYKNTPVYISGNIAALEIVSDKILIDYLIYELHADYVLKQIDSIRLGTSVPYVKIDDLLNIKVQMPSVEEQKAKIKGIKEQMARTLIAEAQLNALAHNMDYLVNENIASLKHSLGKPLMNIGSSLKNIEKALDKMNKNWELFKLSDNLNITLKDTFGSVFSNLDHIHAILKSNESELNLNNYKLEEINYLDFFVEYVKGLKASQSSNIEINLEISELIYESFDSITTNADLLNILLNNIVDNANRHAFTDLNKNYKLSFFIDSFTKTIAEKPLDGLGPDIKAHSVVQVYLKISVANNGKPFPNNFTLEKFIRKNAYAGDTGNTGIGGYDINRIVKYHGGELDLITGDKTGEFSTIFQILIPAYIGESWTF